MYIDVIKKFWIKIRVEKEGATEGANNSNTSKQGAWGGDFGGGEAEKERGEWGERCYVIIIEILILKIYIMALL